MDGNSGGSGTAGNGLSGNWERNGHIQVARPLSDDRVNGAVSVPAYEHRVFFSIGAQESLLSSYSATKPLEDVETIDALLRQMKAKVTLRYSLGQVGPLVMDAESSNGEDTVQMNGAALQGDSKPKADFRQAAEHILLELDQMNGMCISTIVDPQAVEKVMEQLKQKAAYICVAGRYNAGKSTLINALLGSDILPSSRDAETAATVYITVQATNDGTENAIGPPHLYTWPRNGMERLICSGAEEINEHLQRENSRLREQTEAQERELVVKMYVPLFSEFPNVGEGLTPYLVDLPGSNEVCQKKLAKVAKLNVETATAFLYVMTYNELRNEQDFDAIKAIYDRDRQVFDDGRLIIVVTQYDLIYDSSNKTELSVEDVQEKVAELLSNALKLWKPLSKEFIIPVSGLWAFWAKLHQSTEGSVHRNDATMSLLKLSRNATQEKMQEVFSLSFEKTSFRLTEASRILVLEERMKEVMRSMISVWKRGIARNCERFIRTARTRLDEMHQSRDSEYMEVKQMLKKATNLYNLHQKILNTIQEGSEVLEDLKKRYDEDTIPGDKLSILIDELVTTFMTQVKSKKKVTNYLPGELQRDVQDNFRVHAEKEMQAFFQLVKYNRCDRGLQHAINRMAERCGRLRKAGAVFVQNDQESLPTLAEEHGLEEDLDDTLDKKSDKLVELYVPPVEMTLGKWFKLVISCAMLKLFTFNFVRDEDLKELEAHIKRDLQAYYIAHFKQIKEQVVLYFFKIYCQKTEHNLDAFHHLMEDTDVMSLISQCKETNDSLSRELANLKRWRIQTLPELSDSLKLLACEH